jgi:hypothetical protein
MKVNANLTANRCDFVVAAAAERRVIAVEEHRFNLVFVVQFANDPAGIVVEAGEFAACRKAVLIEIGERLPHEEQGGRALVGMRLDLPGIEDETRNDLAGKFQRFIQTGIVRKPKVAPENEQRAYILLHRAMSGNGDRVINDTVYRLAIR